MNRFLFGAILLVIGYVGVIAEEDKSRCNGHYCTDIKGQSGKIDIWRGTKKRSSSDAVRFQMDYIKELDEDGNEVGKDLPKDKKHALESFAPIDFTFSDFFPTTVMGAQADALNFTAKIPGPDATLTVILYFIKENKTMNICNSEYDVQNGSLKINIMLTGWKFCGDAGVDCGKNSRANGSYVEMAALVTAPNEGNAEEDTGGKTKGKKEKGKNIILGNMVMKFPETAKVDNNPCGSMPPNYPKFEQTNKKQKTIFRFKKFMTEVVYDPIVQNYDGGATPRPPITGSSSLKISAMLIVFLAGLAKLLC